MIFLAFDGIINARELGGIPCAGGRITVSGKLLRTAELASASDRDLDVLCRTFRVRHIIDFRDEGERQRSPDREIPGAVFHHLPAITRLPGSAGSYKRMTASELENLFRELYGALAESDESAAAYAGFFRVLLESGGDAVLWHCTQGKDRTGIAALLLLTALGASTGDILADYERTNDGMAEEFVRLSAGGNEDRLAYLRKLLFTIPTCIDTYLERLENLYGGPEGYLRRRLGLGDTEFSLLRRYYTE